MTRFLVFILILGTILGLLAAYVGHRIILRWSWAESHRGVIWFSLGLFVFFQILGPYLYRIYPNHFGHGFTFHWIVYTSLGVFACMLFYTFAADVLLALWKTIFRPDRPVDVERRAFLAISSIALGSSLTGIVQASQGPKIYDIEIPLENLPPDFEGFRIVQITDLHAGPLIGRKYTEEIVQQVNGLDADLVALTGDFVDGTPEQLRNLLAPIAEIRSRNGMFFVTGNHEYYWGAEAWLEEFRRLGASTLVNEHVVIHRNGHDLVVAGVTDYSARQMMPSHASDPRKSIEGAPQDAIKILLAHQPRSYQEASAAGFHLQLSGHTHGGQFFPWSLVVAMSQRYYKGLNRHDKMWIYTSRGAGYWGPPLRFAVPSEITLLRLLRPSNG